MKNKLSGVVALSLGLATAAGAVDRYNIDMDHTTVGFSVKHMVVATVRGKFTQFRGTVMFDENDISNSSVSGTVQVASITTDNARRDAHLKSADFFDAEKFPEIKFISKRIEKTDTGYRAVGDLTMRDVTKEITLDFTISEKIMDPYGYERIGVEAGGVINRQDFGVRWNKAMDNGGVVVSDEVTLELVGEFIKDK